MDKPLTVQEFAKMGGNATLQKHGKDHFKKISQMGVEARKKKREQSAK
jgi:hypothetical protein